MIFMCGFTSVFFCFLIFLHFSTFVSAFLPVFIFQVFGKIHLALCLDFHRFMFFHLLHFVSVCLEINKTRTIINIYS